jgi:tetratricopeptide (TPR) repeat protein
VCCAHPDAETVYADLAALDQHGIKIWYDEDIPAGSSWRGEIAAAIKGAEKLLYFISDSSLHSKHCLREVDYALTHDIEIIPVYLEDVSLPGELDLVLNRVHGLFREKDSMYMEHLVGAVRGESGRAGKPPSRQKRKPQIWLSAVVVAVTALGLYLWSPWKDGQPDPAIDMTVAGTPNAYDHYLEGLRLLERWDKDDNLETAIGMFREAFALDPDFALAYARLADALRIRYALTGEERWLEQATNSVNQAIRLGADLGPVQVALGRVQAMHGNFDLATAALERALAIDPDDAVANQAIAGVYARLGRPEDAETHYRRALALDPENPTIHDAYANFVAVQGDTDGAIGAYQTVIRLAPDNYAARVNLGSVLTDIGRLPGAIIMYKRANEIRPSYMAYSNLGTAYSRSARYPEAIEAYEKALETNSTDWLAWGNLAYVYSWMGGQEALAMQTFEKAIDRAEAAKAQSPRDPYIHGDLALYYAKTWRTESALQHIETALVLASDSGEMLAAAAEVYEMLGRRDQAVDHARRALVSGLPWQNLKRNPELADLLADSRMQDGP